MYNKKIWQLPLMLLTSPIKGFTALKYENQGRISIGILILAVIFINRTLAFRGTGFLVNANNPSEFNSLESLILVLFPFLLFIVGNWSVTSLMEGKGKFREIFLFTSYAMTPLVLFNFIALIYSRIIILEEAPLYFTLLGIGFGWSLLLLFIGILIIHEYSVKKGIITVFLTLAAMGVCIFVLLLMFSLFQQIYGFFYAVVKEISLRYF